MGLFSFKSSFEITVSHPKEEAYKRFHDYVTKKSSLSISECKIYDMLNFTKGMSLLSAPIDFEIIFEELDKSNTKLSVKSESGTIDFGKAKGIINDIVSEIY